MSSSDNQSPKDDTKSALDIALTRLNDVVEIAREITSDAEVRGRSVRYLRVGEVEPMSDDEVLADGETEIESDSYAGLLGNSDSETEVFRASSYALTSESLVDESEDVGSSSNGPVGADPSSPGESSRPGFGSGRVTNKLDRVSLAEEATEVDTTCFKDDDGTTVRAAAARNAAVYMDVVPDLSLHESLGDEPSDSEETRCVVKPQDLQETGVYRPAPEPVLPPPAPEGSASGDSRREWLLGDDEFMFRIPYSFELEQRPELIEMIDKSIDYYVELETERIDEMIKARDMFSWVDYKISRSNQRIFTFDISPGEWMFLQPEKTAKLVSAVGGISTNFPATHRIMMPLLIFVGMIFVVIGFFVLDRGIVLNIGLLFCCVAAFAWFYFNLHQRLTLDVSPSDFVVNSKYRGPLDCLKEVKVDRRGRIVASIDFRQKTIEEVIVAKIPVEQRNYIVDVLNRELDLLRQFEKNG